jgi:hypothetical protein
VGIEVVYAYRKMSGRLYCGSKRSKLEVFACSLVVGWVLTSGSLMSLYAWVRVFAGSSA